MVWSTFFILLVKNNIENEKEILSWYGQILLFIGQKQYKE